MTAIDDYIAAQPEARQAQLRAMAALIRMEITDAVEQIRWGMPTWTRGSHLIHMAGHARHVGIYPGPAMVAAFAPALGELHHSKGAIRFPYDEALPEALIRALARACDGRGIELPVLE